MRLRKTAQAVLGSFGQLHAWLSFTELWQFASGGINNGEQYSLAMFSTD